MKTGLKHLRVLGLFALLAGTSIVLSSCGKNNNANHAPVCPASQYLIYDGAAYSCQVATVSSYGYGQGQYGSQYGSQYGTPYGTNGQVGVLSVPIQACPANQIIVRWTGTWFCYFQDQIYPGGSDSPQGMIPPVGRGGEFCLTGSYYQPQYGSQYGTQYPGQYGTQYPTQYGQPQYGNYANSNTVACSPGLQCVAQGQQPTTTTACNPQIQNCSQYPQQYPQQNLYGQSGLPGTCTH